MASYVNDGNKDEDLLTLYFSASKQGDIPLVKKLISLGFDTNTKNVTGQTAMDLAKNDETALIVYLTLMVPM